MTKGYIGIDIGKKGAIVYQHPDGKIESYVIPMIKDEVDYAFMYDIIQLPLECYLLQAILNMLGNLC